MQDSGWSAAIGAVAALCLLTSGCFLSFGPSWPELERADDEAKEYRPVPGRAVIYLVRDGTVAPTHRIGLYLDGTLLGSLSTHSYIMCVVEPGTHRLATRPTAGTGAAAELELETEAGSIYFVRHAYDVVEPGSPQTTSLALLQPRAGREVTDDLDLVPSACLNPGTSP